MHSAANAYCRASPHDARARIDHACELLDAALAITRDDIRTIATQFEALAQHIQSLLDLTSGIVDCVRQDWVQSTVPMARALASSARRFIAERIDSLAVINDASTNETGMLENLFSLSAEQRSIAREGKTLGVLASIEVARLAGTGKRFEYMARELDQFSAMVLSGVAEVQSQAGRRRETLIERRRKLALALQHRTAYFNSIDAELSAAIVTMEAALLDFARIPADFQRCVALVAANISQIVEAVQVQDITRQQTEHVREVLSRAADGLESCDQQEDPHSARRNAILKVQVFQMKSASASTREWIDEVNQCLESILRIGSSEVLAIGTRILEQERGLSLQLSRIERLEQECAADDVEIEVGLAGIGELMRITKTHLARSRLSRDRMQLLNFNSMIEARHLGSQATAVLEITRNIGRISTSWSALTDRSGDTLDAMLRSSAHAEEVHRTKTSLSLENLRIARHETKAGLAALSTAAATAGGNGGKVKAAITAMQGTSTILGRAVGRLVNSIALMEDAQNEIQDVDRAMLSSVAQLTRDDRLRVEVECGTPYTSELERRVLRAALDGEQMPVPGAAVRGNDVELF
ncbi:hypothetical protein P8935_02220 [Telmatobacter sp. DSM 110680]|uniref:Methyl-accepting transducer domain-containing protein n=1 Tax=Telmatobacter sp. DSM 110680 TaxID=3036704 RepID=A0AAU7DLH4_9BACT